MPGCRPATWAARAFWRRPGADAAGDVARALDGGRRDGCRDGGLLRGAALGASHQPPRRTGRARRRLAHVRWVVADLWATLRCAVGPWLRCSSCCPWHRRRASVLTQAAVAAHWGAGARRWPCCRHAGRRDHGGRLLLAAGGANASTCAPSHGDQPRARGIGLGHGAGAGHGDDLCRRPASTTSASVSPTPVSPPSRSTPSAAAPGPLGTACWPRSPTFRSGGSACCSAAADEQGAAGDAAAHRGLAGRAGRGDLCVGGGAVAGEG